MLQQIDARAAHLEKVDADVREWEKKHAKQAEANCAAAPRRSRPSWRRSHAGKHFCVAEVPDADGKLLQAVADALKTKFNGPIFLAGASEWNLSHWSHAVPKELTSKFQANKLIQQIAPIVGGKGGGRPDKRARRRQRPEQNRTLRWQERGNCWARREAGNPACQSLRGEQAQLPAPRYGNTRVTKNVAASATARTIR